MSQESLLTISIKKEITPFAFGNICFEGDRVTGIQEKPDIVMNILAGIYVMKPKILDLFPVNEYFGMDSLILKMLDEGSAISKYDLNEYWLDIGRITDYEKAKEVYSKQF